MKAILDRIIQSILVFRFTKTFTVASLLLFSTTVNAAIDCTGLVTGLGLHLDNGIVILSLSSGPYATLLCSTDGPTKVNDISHTVCRTMYATLMAAKLAGKKVLIRFYDHYSCYAVPSWRDAGRLGWSDLLID